MALTSFNLRAGGPQALLAAAVIAICFVAWCVQLGGVASLQAACNNDLTLDLNNIDPTIAFLQQQLRQQAALATARQQLTLLAATIPKLPSLPAQNQTALITKSLYALTSFTVTLMDELPVMMESLASLTSRSTSGVFTLTPDQECAAYYRYQWLNTALQLVVLVLAVYALFTNLLATARVTICCMLTVATVLAIENAHTFFYVRKYAPDLSLIRGKVFFVGCVITASTNLLLLFVLGIHDEASEAADHAPRHAQAYQVSEQDKDKKLASEQGDKDNKLESEEGDKDKQPSVVAHVN